MSVKDRSKAQQQQPYASNQSPLSGGFVLVPLEIFQGVGNYPTPAAQQIMGTMRGGPQQQQSQGPSWTLIISGDDEKQRHAIEQSAKSRGLKVRSGKARKENDAS